MHITTFRRGIHQLIILLFWHVEVAVSQAGIDKSHFQYVRCCVVANEVNPPELANYCKNEEYADTPTAQSVLALPGFDERDFFLLNYQLKNIGGDSFANISPLHLLLNRIDLSQNDGPGKVVEKRTVILNDTLGNGYLQAVKHANGRDW